MRPEEQLKDYERLAAGLREQILREKIQNENNLRREQNETENAYKRKQQRISDGRQYF